MKALAADVLILGYSDPRLQWRTIPFAFLLRAEKKVVLFQRFRVYEDLGLPEMFSLSIEYLAESLFPNGDPMEIEKSTSLEGFVRQHFPLSGSSFRIWHHGKCELDSDPLIGCQMFLQIMQSIDREIWGALKELDRLPKAIPMELTAPTALWSPVPKPESDALCFA